ncbi:hypothetical protein [Azospirillum doebereinerae]
MTASTATTIPRRSSHAAAFSAGLRRCAVPLALWQAGVGLGWISTRSIPSPNQILIGFWNLAVSAGLAIGLSAGTVCALIAGLTRRGEDALDALLQMLRTLPQLGEPPRRIDIAPAFDRRFNDVLSQPLG